MTNINEAFPSKYLKESDLQGREAHVVMNAVNMETIGSDERPVLYFQGKEKGLVLNVTNKNTIVDAYGEETDDWFGKTLVLFPTRTDYQGRNVPCIRVKLPVKRTTKPGPKRDAPISPPPLAEPGFHYESEIDDEIPF